MKIKHLPIDRSPCPDSDTLTRQHLSNSGWPLVITGLASSWPAASKWTFDYFKNNYGDTEVYLTCGDPKERPRKSTIAEYVNYILEPEGTVLKAQERKRPWYLSLFRPFMKFPKLLEDIDPPKKIDNWFSRLPTPMDQWYLDGFGWIFLGTEGCFTPAHTDTFSTHAWIAQISGRKRFVMVPPGWKPGASYLDTVLHPGEILIIPWQWKHEVLSLEPTISVSFNFINETNFSDWLMSTLRDPDAWQAKNSSSAMQSLLGIKRD